MASSRPPWTRCSSSTAIEGPRPMAEDTVQTQTDTDTATRLNEAREAARLSREAPRPSELPEDARGKKQWYVIHTYSGYENKVKANLEHRIESMGVEDQ